MARIVTWVITLMLCQWALQVAGKTPVSPSLVKKFVRYTELSSAGYAKDCRVPPQGVKIISRIRGYLTNTDGFLAKDEEANELVVVLRGTDNLPDVLTDIKIRKVPYKSQGVSECPGCKVHRGFLNSWESIAKNVLGQVKGIVDDNPGIKVTVTGHSLGASLASLAAMSLIGSGINVTTYTFGQPRTGNRAFAEYVDKQAPPGTMYRVTHANDGIPQIFPTVIGYRHHSTEYWQTDGLAGMQKVFKCSGQEPVDCNNSKFGFAINAAHLRYFGVPIGVPIDRGTTICHSKKLNGFQVAAGLVGF